MPQDIKRKCLTCKSQKLFKFVSEGMTKNNRRLGKFKCAECDRLVAQFLKAEGKKPKKTKK